MGLKCVVYSNEDNLIQFDIEDGNKGRVLARVEFSFSKKRVGRDPKEALKIKKCIQFIRDYMDDYL